ncbi:MAG: ADP-glyceromanno-heptose 6-epimerase [Deltaproteobacteria bacterium RIFCSPLOWO2_01_FULL_38_9]|nr:MAG: ADP-glyceromanno-heptose 6-epimerase [Deltaproteobacteria bacterium RIFCSPLOWO2_01_FULL_38_9]
MSKPILVTGAAGFIGSAFVESCNRLNIPVISVDEPTYFTSRSEHKALQFGQIIDRERLFEWLESKRPVLSAIVHIGACTDTTEMDEAYLSKMNLEYTKKIWEYATKHALPLVYASSAATYGDGALGYDDDERLIPKLKPMNPYGESKQQFDLWALEQEKQGKHPPSWSGFKFFNVYGFGERHKEKMSSVVIQAFDQINQKGFIKLFKSHREGIPHGHQERDFVYVGDVIQVLHFALQKPIQRGIYNLGTGKARTFLDLARAVFKELHKPEKIEFMDTPIQIRGRYQYFTQAKMDQLKAQGYHTPFTSLEEGIHQYIQKLHKFY